MTKKEFTTIVRDHIEQHIGQPVDPDTFKKAMGRVTRHFNALLGPRTDWQKIHDYDGAQNGLGFYQEVIKGNENTFNRVRAGLATS